MIASLRDKLYTQKLNFVLSANHLSTVNHLFIFPIQFSREQRYMDNGLLVQILFSWLRVACLTLRSSVQFRLQWHGPTSQKFKLLYQKTDFWSSTIRNISRGRSRSRTFIEAIGLLNEGSGCTEIRRPSFYKLASFLHAVVWVTLIHHTREP